MSPAEYEMERCNQQCLYSQLIGQLSLKLSRGEMVVATHPEVVIFCSTVERTLMMGLYYYKENTF